MNDIKGQLTVRGIVIGCVGCTVITASSAYVALKLGALPWPIVFAAIVSLFFLKALGKTTLNEANVTHTIMSAGSMVAGGLAFTIPAAWMLGLSDEIGLADMLVVALAGTILGLVSTAVLRKHFIEEAALEYPIGESAAQTLIAGDRGGAVGAKLFGSMAVAGAYTALREAGAMPAVLLSNIAIPGVSFGVYNSPMMFAVGYIVGPVSVAVWAAGAVIGSFVLVSGASALGVWDLSFGQEIASSAGMGVMMGCGFAVVLRDVLPGAVRALRKAADRPNDASRASGAEHGETARTQRRSRTTIGAIAIAAAALGLCMVCGLSPAVSVCVVLFSFVTCAMSAQSVGQTGMDPMEVFGLIVLLVIAAFSDTPQTQLFFAASVIAVACGLAGDVMNDFYAGHVLGTNPRAQWLGQAVGGVLGSFVSVTVMTLLLAAYGPDSFGPGGDFIATQASVIATMVLGIPCPPAFCVGLVAGIVLYLAKVPSMMLGLGLYLPFYMSAAAIVGSVVHLVARFVGRRRAAKGSGSLASQEETGIVVASGVLGGESVVSLLAAFASIALHL